MMHEMIVIFGLSLLPATGNFLGGLLAEWMPLSKKILNFSLHAGAGVMLAVIAVEVMPQALKNTPSWILAASFLFGGVVYLLLEKGIQKLQKNKNSKIGVETWMVYLAVAVDLIGDGLLIGIGSTVSTELAILIAFGQILADIPEGFAVTANFRDKGVGQIPRLILSASFSFFVIGSALLSYLLLRNQDEVIKMASLVFVSGIYILAAVEDILSEAHRSAKDTQVSSFSFLTGFAFFLFISGWVK